LIAKDLKCEALSERLDFVNKNSPIECADLCLSAEGCYFFLYDASDGECRWSKTLDETCPEGLSQSNFFDFWAIGIDLDLPPQDNSDNGTS
jgi:hypothetical protein